MTRLGLRKLAMVMMFTLLLQAVWVTQQVQASGVTYYVDANGGNDANLGTSEGSAWRTITKVRAAVLQPGDSVLFKRGQSWYGKTLQLASSGAEGNPIRIGAYGEGAKPIISGAILETGWIGPDANGEYAKSGYPSGNNSLASIMEDGIRLPGNGYLQALPGQVKGSLTPGSWVWDAATSSIYYKPSSGTPSDHTVEISTFSGSYAFGSNGKSNIEVSDLELRSGYSYSVLIFNNSSNVVLKNNTIRGAGRYGVRIFNADNNSLLSNEITDAGYSGVVIENGADNNVIDGNHIAHIGQLPSDDGNLVGIYVGADSGQARSTHNTLSHNDIEHIGKDWYKGKLGSTSTGLMYSTGIHVESTSETQILNNRIHDVWRGGIAVFTANADALNTNIIGNVIFDAGKMTEVNQYNSGIYLNNSKGKISGTQILHNTITNANFHSSTNREAGIYVKAHGTGTIPGASAAFDNMSVINNLIAGSIGDYALTYEFEPGVSVSNFTSDYNLLRPDSGGGVYSREGSSVTIYNASHIVGAGSTYFSSARNKDTHSVTGDPLFVNAAGADYHLGVGSAAVDTGTITSVATDMDGYTVPFGYGTDIGAYESQTLQAVDTIAPIISGVTDGETYHSVVTVTYNEETGVVSRDGGVTMPFTTGTSFGDEGNYAVTVTDAAYNVTTVHFNMTYLLIPVANVEIGQSYSVAVTPTFAVGSATLTRNGGEPTAYTTGTPVSLDGVYVLSVTAPYTLPTTIMFTIDSTPPVITGVANGATYVGSVTPLFNEGVGVLTQFITETIQQTRTIYTRESTSYSPTAQIGEVIELIESAGTEQTTVIVKTKPTIVDLYAISGTTITQPGSYQLTVTNAAYLVSQVNFEVVPVPEVIVVHYDELQALITSAMTIKNTAREGIANGNFFPGSLNKWKTTFNTSIIQAQSVAANLVAIQTMVDHATEELQAAIQLFESYRITSTTGDLNHDTKPGYDAGDIQIALKYMWKSKTSANWAQARIADVNQDDVVNLIDLAFITQRVLSRR
ncbi:hypothetical protein GC096_36005 [Paenibacillus sp. LMG 31461]|uniref:Right handed beta helix domain-containing protein n=1 Tax=Paenibacillus plantarum TaxID=2654975 RepID=A0ABX1XNI0_9BACL|nr:right-handed parallel beta-helix repeat-containing protein [Paenibacillus plantarum]NOU69425.1 hypothetical protein [Paenibacillus plantarum]